MDQADDDSDFLLFLCERNEAKVKEVIAALSEDRGFIFEERLARAGQLVDEGNALFKSADFKAANDAYLRAAHQVDFDFGQQWEMTPDHKGQIRAAKVRVLLNVANCGLKLAEFPATVRAASLGLRLCQIESETKAKFLYRRAKANAELGNWDLAVEDLQKALKIVPSDFNVRELLAASVKAARAAKASSYELWKGRAGLFEAAYPPVELILTNPDGTRIDAPAEQTSVTPPSLLQRISDAICCKRKRKLN